MLRFDFISANPRILENAFVHGLISRAASKELIGFNVHDLREYAEGKYRQIDDVPYGGGAGMILKPEPFFRCIKRLKRQRQYDEIIFLSPQGKTFDQRLANSLSMKKNLLVLCGHYKGIDERVVKRYVTMELSIGDYVVSCGDIAAIVLADAVTRLIPGALGDGESAITDSFQVDTGFDSPQYTRPPVYDRMKVPEVLLSGNHKLIREWREMMAEKKFKESGRFKTE